MWSWNAGTKIHFIGVPKNKINADVYISLFGTERTTASSHASNGNGTGTGVHDITEQNTETRKPRVEERGDCSISFCEDPRIFALCLHCTYIPSNLFWSVGEGGGTAGAEPVTPSKRDDRWWSPSHPQGRRTWKNLVSLGLDSCYTAIQGQRDLLGNEKKHENTPGAKNLLRSSRS